jgi:hypothetical protein
VSLSAGEEFKINPSDTDREWYIDTTNADHLKKERNMVLSADPDNVHASTTIGFRIDNSTLMQLNSSGNLGIGTTTHTEKLHVAGKISNDQFQIPNTAGTSGQILQWPSTGTTLEWATPSGGGGGGSDVWRVSSNMYHSSNVSTSWYFFPINGYSEGSQVASNAEGVVANGSGYVSKIVFKTVRNGGSMTATSTRFRVEINRSVVWTGSFISHGTTSFTTITDTLGTTDATFTSGDLVTIRFNTNGLWYEAIANLEYTYT